MRGGARNCLQQLDDTVGESAVAEDDRQVGLVGDLFEDLELAQAHEGRVGLEEARGVGLRAVGGRELDALLADKDGVARELVRLVRRWQAIERCGSACRAIPVGS